MERDRGGERESINKLTIAAAANMQFAMIGDESPLKMPPPPSDTDSEELSRNRQFRTVGEESLFQNRDFDKIVKKAKVFPKVKTYYPREVSSLLGSTHDFIIQDLNLFF